MDFSLSLVYLLYLGTKAQVALQHLVTLTGS